jgi:polar amino acid transport system substrate-binding protein
MKVIKGLRRLGFVLVLHSSVPSAMADDLAHDVIADLAPNGRLRAAINFGNPVLAQRDPATGAPGGVSVELAKELGRRLGVPVDFVPFDAAGKVVDALKTRAWDVAFLAIDPVRGAEIDFTAPYVVIEGTYLVRANSPLRSVDEVDREGVRIAAAQASAYELYLTRTLKHAKLIRAPSWAAAIETFLQDQVEALAGVRQVLVEFAKARPDLHVMSGRFMAIEQAMATPKGRKVGAGYLREFVETMKSSGFVGNALVQTGQVDATVAR